MIEINDKIKFLKSLKKYYPIGIYNLDSEYKKIRDLIYLKVENKLPISTSWLELINNVKKITDYEVGNKGHFYSPSLSFSIMKFEETGGIRTLKKLTFSISIISNYYTYFFGYINILSVENKPTPLPVVLFLNDENYNNCKLEIDIEKIIELINVQFPNYKYINHYDLMKNEIAGGVPFGEDLSSASGNKYTYYDYFFENSDNILKINI